MSRKRIMIIVRTGILLALTVVLQYVGRYIPLGPNSNFIVGPLVNACLLVSTVAAGLWGGALISVAAPLFAALTTHSAMSTFILVFSPFIAAGNFVLVLMFHLFREKSKWTGIVVGALFKFAILFSGVKFMLGVREVPDSFRPVLTFMFGWPQLVTAALGGIIAITVLNALKGRLELPEERD